MIAISSSRRSFAALAAYLAPDRANVDPNRVAWITARNLPTADPELAATMMRATAAQNSRVTEPVYHVALSFDPADAVDRATMERVADRVIDALKLQEHQVLIVAHGDREHPHVHLLVNRIHPESGRAWSRWQDQRIVQEVLRAEEHALGLREVPGKLTTPQLALALEARQPAQPSREELGTASVPTDRGASRVQSLAKDIRDYGLIQKLSKEEYDAHLTAQGARARVTQLDLAVARTQAAEAAFHRALGTLYRQPEQARIAFARMVDDEGLGVALQALRDQPEQFGALGVRQQRSLLGLVYREGDESVHRAAQQAAAAGREAVEAVRAAWSEFSELRVRRLEESFARELATIYEQPRAAGDAFAQLARVAGAREALKVLAERPDSLGSLWSGVARKDDHPQSDMHQGVQHAAQVGAELVAAQAAARTAAIRLYTAQVNHDLVTGEIAAEAKAAKGEYARATAHEEAIKEQLHRLPDQRELRHRIASTMERLLPQELVRFRRLASGPELATANELRAAIRAAVLDRDTDR